MPQWERFKRYLPKIVAVLLALQTAWGLIQSMLFIFVKYPVLEQQLASHQITSEEVTSLTNHAILTVLSVLVGAIFAIRITAMKSKTAKIINTTIGILLVVVNVNIARIVAQLGTEQLVTELAVNAFLSLFRLQREVQSTLPEVPSELLSP